MPVARILAGRVLLALALLGVSAQAHADPIRHLAGQLAKGAGRLVKRKALVLPFPDAGHLTASSISVQDQLTAKLSGRHGLQVLKASQVRSYLTQSRINPAELVNPDVAQRIGLLLGVDAVVAGGLAETDTHRCTAEAVLINTGIGEILASAQAKWKKSCADLAPALTSQH
ncbi:MAG TPA: hypothetical protein VMU17_05850 [Elusimicrobiota bacterium]|nr:hypothetical protein [Elusimicrobiota bacterium]